VVGFSIAEVSNMKASPASNLRGVRGQVEACVKVSTSGPCAAIPRRARERKRSGGREGGRGRKERGWARYEGGRGREEGEGRGSERKREGERGREGGREKRVNREI
jgi:hypothetical protein